jgi:hypothetical protein
MVSFSAAAMQQKQAKGCRDGRLQHEQAMLPGSTRQAVVHIANLSAFAIDRSVIRNDIAVIGSATWCAEDGELSGGRRRSL